MATGWDLALLLGILGGSAVVLLLGAGGLAQYLRLRRRRGALEPGSAWLSGTARPAGDDLVTAPISDEPALCVEYALEREGGKVARRVWRAVETERASVAFDLETHAGTVRVDPSDASLDLAEDAAETFDDPTALREALPASMADAALDDADRYRLTEWRLSPGDAVDATGRLQAGGTGPPTLSGPGGSTTRRRLLSVPFVLADPGRDGGAGAVRDRAFAGFVLGLPPALLALVLLFPP
jgi:hypothetical protein